MTPIPAVSSKFPGNADLTNIVTVAISTRVALTLADLIVIIATWVKMFNQVRNAMHLRTEVRASTIMLTDGEPISLWLLRIISQEPLRRQFLFHVSPNDALQVRQSYTNFQNVTLR